MMDVQARVIYDPAEIVRLIENELDKLRIYRFDSTYRNLLGESFTSMLGRWEHDILARKDDPYTIVVCGEFKKGKSSLINALLGEDAAPADVTPETVTLNRISYGAHANEAILSGGKRLLLSDEEMERDHLEQLMKETKEPFHRIEVKRPLDFLKKAVIIDTPGLGDSMQDYAEMVEEALVQADAVVYVFSVAYPLSQTEQLFLKTMILPQQYTDLMLVGNYLDLLNSEEDYARIEQLLEKRIEQLLPDQKAFMLSALDERCRQLDEERPNPDMVEALEAHFDAYRTALDKLVRDKQENVIPDRMQRMTRGMLFELGQYLDAMESGLHMSAQEAQDAAEELEKEKAQKIGRQEETKQQIETEIKRMKGETKAWMDDLLIRMQAEVQQLEDVSSEDLMKYYTFYCTDMISEALDRCLDQHVLELYDKVDTISADLSARFSKTMTRSSYSFQFTLDNRTWTRGDNVGYVVSKVNSLALVSLVTDVVAGAMREKEIEKKTPDILKSIGEQYGSLRHSVDAAIDGSYDRMAGNLMKQIDAYNQEQLKSDEELVKASYSMARQDQDRKQEIQSVIDSVRGILAEITSDLEGMA